MSSAGRQPGAASAGVEISVNGDPTSLAAGTTVTVLLEELGMAGRKVAVAVDRVVVPRSRYGDTLLAPGQRVEILEAVGGG